MSTTIETDNVLTEYLFYYYKEFLDNSEKIDLDKLNDKSILEFGFRASSLKKFILDAYEENYQKETDDLVLPLNALNRLDKLIDSILKKLNRGSEFELFYLYKKRIDLKLGENSFYEEKIELYSFLKELKDNSDLEIDICECFDSKKEMLEWIDKTDLMLKEILAFTKWSLKFFKNSDKTPLFLLRDTLFVYLGYSWLYDKKLITKEPKPMLLSRKFLSFCEGNIDFYDEMVDYIYITLPNNPQNLSEIGEMFSKEFNKIPDNFQKNSLEYLKDITNSEPFIAIESGMHGTIPLWLMHLSRDKKSKFLLYSTTDWLYNIYEESVYQRNFNYLRELETSLLQDSYFQFDSYQDKKVFIKKSSQSKVKKLALYELTKFKKLFEKEFNFT